MPYTAGTFALFTPGNPVVTGTTVASTWANNTLTDIATGLSTAVLKDGTQTVTANLPMAGFKLTGLGAGTVAGDSLRYEQLFAATTAITIPDNILKISNSVDATKLIAFSAGTISPSTTRTLTAQDKDVTVAAIAEFAYSGIAGSPGRLILPNDYISGFALTNNGATGFDVAAGQAMDSTNAVNIIGSAIANKTQAAWVAGTGNGGKLSAAAMASNTWYYWFALYKTSDGSVDYGFDVSTTPTLPTGYSKFRYLGGRKTQSASTNWDTFIQHGDEVIWGTPPALDVSAGVTTANRTLTTMNVPAQKVLWYGNGMQQNPGSSTTVGFIATDPAAADVAPSVTASPLSSNGNVLLTTVTIARVAVQMRCWTNSSGQIGLRGMTSDSIAIATLGWMDPRGKPV